MDKEKEICLYLKKHHTGQENAVFSKELERLFSMNGRTIRRIISHLRQTGNPICSSCKGYYYARTQNELVTGVSNSRTALLYAKIPKGQPSVEITIRIGGGEVQ